VDNLSRVTLSTGDTTKPHKHRLGELLNK
jgi:hypothetical protein